RKDIESRICHETAVILDRQPVLDTRLHCWILVSATGDYRPITDWSVKDVQVLLIRCIAPLRIRCLGATLQHSVLRGNLDIRCRKDLHASAFENTRGRVRHADLDLR